MMTAPETLAYLLNGTAWFLAGAASMAWYKIKGGIRA